MLTVAGLVFSFICIFGSFILTGGALGPLMEVLPFEFITIGGGALGTFLAANSFANLKHTIHDIIGILKGSRFKKDHYIELLSLLYYLTKLAVSKGAIGLEPHIEDPKDSEIFQKFPKVLSDPYTTALICDYLRMVSMNVDDPVQIEDVMARELKKHMSEGLHSSHALQTVSDALPAFGIVAAVLGVIKTMSNIDKPPAILGAMIGEALTGTFLGILLAYTVAAPLANRIRNIVEEESRYYEVIRAVIVAHLYGNAPQVSIEAGRKMVPSNYMPSFQTLEGIIDELPHL